MRVSGFGDAGFRAQDLGFADAPSSGAGCWRSAAVNPGFVGSKGQIPEFQGLAVLWG